MKSEDLNMVFLKINTEKTGVALDVGRNQWKFDVYRIPAPYITGIQMQLSSKSPTGSARSARISLSVLRDKKEAWRRLHYIFDREPHLSRGNFIAESAEEIRAEIAEKNTRRGR